MSTSDKDGYSKFNVKLLSIMSYIGPLFLAAKLSVEKEAPLVKFHSSQGLRLFILEVLAAVIVLAEYFLLSSYDTVREILSLILIVGFSMATFVMIILGIISAAKGSFVKLPFVFGKKAKKI